MCYRGIETGPVQSVGTVSILSFSQPGRWSVQFLVVYRETGQKTGGGTAVTSIKSG